MTKYIFNYEKLFSPIFMYPLRHPIIGIETTIEDVFLLIQLNMDSETKKINKLKFYYHTPYKSYEPKIFESINSGITVKNYSLSLYSSYVNYSSQSKLYDFLKELLYPDNINNARMYSKNWDKLKSCSGEEYFDLIYRTKNPHLKQRGE